jgi:hypothetical protein
MVFPLALPPPDPGFEILISSQGMSQGLLLTEGIQLFPRATLRMGSAQLGVQWRNVDSPAADGVAALFAKYSRRAGKVRVDVTARYRIRTGHRGLGKPTSWEFSAAGRRSFGKLAIQASADFSPQEFGNGRSLYAEIVPVLDLGESRISAGIGRRFRQSGPNYTTFNLGIARTVASKVTLDARIHATDRGDLGERYKARVVLSARLTL